MASEEVFNFFIERHIVLKEDWLNAVIKFLSQSKIQGRNICEAVYEQWLFADLKDSSYPIFDQIGIGEVKNKDTITSPFIAQIASISDVGSSLYSQYKKLTYEFTDNSGFEALPDQESVTISASKRMLLLILSDGKNSCKAMEYFSIPQLSLLTTPGCKVLLFPTITYRKGILMLKNGHCQVLGGDVGSLMESGRPVEVMAVRLGIMNINKNENNKNQAGDMNQAILPISEPDVEVNLDPIDTYREDNYNENNFSSNEAVSLSEAPASFVSRSRSPDNYVFSSRNSTQICSNSSANALTSLSSIHLKKKTGINISQSFSQTPKERVPNKGCLTSVVPSRNCDIRLEDSPPRFDTPKLNVNSDAQNSILTNKFSKSNRKRSSILSKCLNPDNDHPNSGLIDLTSRSDNIEDFCRPMALTSNSFQSPPKKKIAQPSLKAVKLEIIELSDDEDNVTETVNIASKSEENVIISVFPPCIDGSLYCQRYEQLKIVRIADAIRRSRFAVGSVKCVIEAVMTDVIEALRIVDKHWTQKIEITDMSSKLVCYIDDPTLSSLIGLTTQQAMEIKKSSDACRRKDGSRRLSAVSTQMQRLDLLFTVEFFSGGLADAVIRSIQTLPQAISLFS